MTKKEIKQLRARLLAVYDSQEANNIEMIKQLAQGNIGTNCNIFLQEIGRIGHGNTTAMQKMLNSFALCGVLNATIKCLERELNQE